MNRIPGFDGLRAVAVLMVYFHHFALTKPALGTLGVHLFFVISGYLIVGILHRQRQHVEEAHTTIGQQLLIFWSRRAVRLFPAYYLLLALLVAALVQAGRDLHAEAIVPWYVLISANIPIAAAQKWNSYSHLWSLAVEQHFYLLTSALLLWAPTRLHVRWLQALLAASLATLAFRAFDGTGGIAIYVSSWCNFAFFAAGGLLALTHWQQHRLAKRTRPIVVACMSSFLIAALMQPLMSRPVWTALLATASLLTCSAVIAHLLMHSAGTAARALETAPLRYLGTISYGFYLFHLPLPWPDIGKNQLVLAVAFKVLRFLVCIGIAALSWHWIEKPIQQLARPQPKA